MPQQKSVYKVRLPYVIKYVRRLDVRISATDPAVAILLDPICSNSRQNSGALFVHLAVFRSRFSRWLLLDPPSKAISYGHVAVDGIDDGQRAVSPARWQEHRPKDRVWHSSHYTGNYKARAVHSGGPSSECNFSMGEKSGECDVPNAASRLTTQFQF